MNLAHTRGHRGFTLIELLVVIAIIGILSAVVLASLNSARTKGVDAAVKSNIATIQTQAELYYDDNGNYAGTAHALGACNMSATGNMFANATIKSAITNTNSTLASTTAVRCYASTGANSAYMVYSSLKQGGFYCIDSTGNATTTATVGATTCI